MSDKPAGVRCPKCGGTVKRAAAGEAPRCTACGEAMEPEFYRAKRAELKAEMAKFVEEQKTRELRRGNILRKTLFIAIPAVILIIAGVICFNLFATPMLSYRRAEKLLDSGSYDEAIEAFSELGNYRDALTQMKESKYRKADSLLLNGDYEAARKLFRSLYNYEDSVARESETVYSNAMHCEQSGDIYNAILLYRELDDSYSDAAQRAESLCTPLFNAAVQALDAGDNALAMRYLIELSDYDGAFSYAQTAAAKLQKTVSCGTGSIYIVRSSTGMLLSNGSLTAAESNGIENWSGLTAVSAGYEYVVGLRSDGTAVAAGSDHTGRTEVGSWSGLTAVSAGYGHTVGLRNDGTVVATGDNEYLQCDVDSWKNVTDLSAGAMHTVALLSDGTAVATGDNSFGQCDVSDWTDLVAVFCGNYYTLGLRSDGTVVAAGDNAHGQCDVSSWTNIISVSAADTHSAAIRSDGVVLSCGDNSYEQTDTSYFDDMLTIACADNFFTIMINRNGSLSYAGVDADSKNFGNWTLFDFAE